MIKLQGGRVHGHVVAGFRVDTDIDDDRPSSTMGFFKRVTDLIGLGYGHATTAKAFRNFSKIKVGKINGNSIIACVVANHTEALIV